MKQFLSNLWFYLKNYKAIKIKEKLEKTTNQQTEAAAKRVLEAFEQESFHENLDRSGKLDW